MADSDLDDPCQTDSLLGTTGSRPSLRCRRGGIPLCGTALRHNGTMSVSDVLETLNDGADRELGAVVLALDAMGEDAQADLLVACTLAYEFGSDWMDGMSAIPVLSADPSVHGLLSNVTLDYLEARCRELNSNGYVQIDPLRVRLATASGDWRERRQEARDQGGRPVNNQATYRSASSIRRADRLAFASNEELKVYMALVRRQQRLPPESTIAIIPGPGTRVLGRTFWPDFLVSHQRRVGMIEVDGPHHYGRAAADHSRDSLFNDAGMSYVERVAVEDSASEAELDTFVERFLQRLLR